MSGFVHLHLHTEYSLLDGACRIERVIEKAKNMGQTAVAITDHGAMYGVIDFYNAAKKHGIKPIIGCEVYVSEGSRFNATHAAGNDIFHLVLLCKNHTGYQNLLKLVSSAWTEGFYKKPRIDHELLEKYSEGLIGLSACLAGEIPRALSGGDYQKALKIARYYESVFKKGNFYLELQDHNLPEQKAINPQILRLSKETGIPPVVTNDAHYIEKEDSRAQQILICIQTNHTIFDDNRLEFGSDEFYLKSEAEMRSLFPDCPEAADNTVKIAKQCNVEFEFGRTKLPRFEIPGNVSHFEYFRQKCYEGLHRKYGPSPDSFITDRLEYELTTIEQMGYVDYYLIVYDFIDYAVKNGIPVGPGRGSGAGSLAAYCIGITGIDPIKYNLLFERFLNPERISMPDFDIDFCYERRSKVIEYVIEKYGADHVAQIITFGTMAARAAIRDVGRALGIPYAEVDTIAKLIPFELHMTIERALNISPELNNLYNSSDKIKDLIDMAKKLEGTPRNASTHAAGVVITDQPVDSYVPLAKNNDSVVTQFTMTTLEELGLLKIDFLGLRTLTVIHDSQEMIRRKNPEFTIEDIPLDDQNVFKMLQNGLTEGVFQFESAGMKNVLVSLSPTSVEDLIAVISLYRPGPMESIPKYIKNRHHPDAVQYDTPLLKDILDVTYGCLIYQEQVMEVFRKLGGYSYGRADIVRRAMSKKKHKVMEQERKYFIYGTDENEQEAPVDGAVKRGIRAEVANKIFDDMSSFASYAFNKSHAAAYAFIAYRTAYLKCYHKAEFMAALLTSVLDNTSKVAEYIAECQQLNITVDLPGVNESFESFTVTEDGKIRFSLLAIKNLGRPFIQNIINERSKNGKFHSFYDFCKRMYGQDFNKRACESLIKAGALDNLGANRRQMLQGISVIIDQLEADKRRNFEGQLGLFDSDEISTNSNNLPFVPELPKEELLKMEKEITGIYLSGHPMAAYIKDFEKIGAAKISDILQSGDEMSPFQDESRSRIFGIVSKVNLKATKSNSTMAFLTVEDMSGTIEVLVFPKILEANPLLMREENIVIINGKVSIREERDPQIICDEIFDVSKIPSLEKASKAGLYLKFTSRESAEYFKAIERLHNFYGGNTPLYFYFEDTKKKHKAPVEKSVKITNGILDDLKLIMGAGNVAIVE